MRDKFTLRHLSQFFKLGAQLMLNVLAASVNQVNDDMSQHSTVYIHLALHSLPIILGSG